MEDDTDKPRLGRPFAKNPKNRQHMVRLDADDEVIFAAEAERLEREIGGRWTVGSYLRAAGRAHLGKIQGKAGGR